jgi:ferric-dicitrate binding protein FerR (iron transport regulator)
MHPSNLSLWKNRVIYFYDTPLAEVMSVLERQFNVTFNLQSADALKYSYTLTTKHATLERVLNELQKIAPVKFSVMEDQIQVSM